MLISFTVENWMSFRDKQTLDMIASGNEDAIWRIPNLEKYDDAKVLPVSAIFGGNASGKSNLLLALKFAKHFIAEGSKPDKPILVKPFSLDNNSSRNPSSFSFEILAGDTIYEYSFSATRKKVVSEKLVEIQSDIEIVLYERDENNIVLGESLSGVKHMQYAAQCTRDNMLYLTNGFDNQIEKFYPISDWFSDTLQLVSPDKRLSEFDLTRGEIKSICEKLGESANLLGTGIERVESIEVDFANLPFDKYTLDDIRCNLRPGEVIRVRADHNGNRYLIEYKEALPVAHKIIPFHSTIDGQTVQFEMVEVSDGIKSLIDLLPTFIDLVGHDPDAPKVYVIDDIDRNLHPLLIEKIVDEYSESCSDKTRSQMIFTSHSTELMGWGVLRDDEIWLTEVDTQGVSSIFSVSQFEEAPKGTTLSTNYLQGRMGGLPPITMGDALS